jgi:hypothetical protein
MKKFITLTEVAEQSKFSELKTSFDEESAVTHAVTSNRFLRPICLNIDYIVRLKEDAHIKYALETDELGALGNKLDTRHEFTKIYMSGGNSSMKAITVVGSIQQIINKIQETENE